MSDSKEAFDAFYKSDQAQELIRDELFTCLARDAFIAGAAWQRERDAKLVEAVTENTRNYSQAAVREVAVAIRAQDAKQVCAICLGEKEIHIDHSPDGPKDIPCWRCVRTNQENQS